MIGSSVMAVNPNIPDAHVLRGWYDSVGVNQSSTATSSARLGSGGAATFNRAEIRAIEDIKANLRIVEKAEMFSCRGTILDVGGENLAYPACPNQSCRKKVTDTEEGWHCKQCGKTWEKPEYRYITRNLVPGSAHVLVGTRFPWGSLILPDRLGCKASMT